MPGERLFGGRRFNLKKKFGRKKRVENRPDPDLAATERSPLRARQPLQPFQMTKPRALDQNMTMVPEKFASQRLNGCLRILIGTCDN